MAGLVVEMVCADSAAVLRRIGTLLSGLEGIDPEKQQELVIIFIYFMIMNE